MTANCPYPEPQESSLCPHIPLPEDPEDLSKYNPPIYALVFQVVSFPHFSPPKPCIHLYSSHMCYIPHPAHFFYLMTQTILGEEYRSLSSSLCSFLHSPVTSSLFSPNILLSTLFSNTLSLCSSFNVSDLVSQQYKTTGKIIVLYTLIFKLLDSKLIDKRFWTE